MLLHEITTYLERWAPLPLQESYDNCGLLIGHPGQEITGALITLDVTEEVLKEAAENNCNLIIAHHPLIFGGLKKLNGKNMVERIAIAAIKNDIAIYAIHTNLDNTLSGVNQKIADKIGLKNGKILDMKRQILRKLITFCPDTKLDDGRQAPDAVREALWKAGAGNIGNYDKCSTNSTITGTFRAGEDADPLIGEEGELVKQEEERIEVIFPFYKQNDIIKALWDTHPYEEVAYDILTLENEYQETGSGMSVRYSPLTNQKIKWVAVCGGSGQFLLKTAMAKGAHAFVTADFKYHQFFDAEGKILIADIGHYESEQFTVELIYDKLKEKFSTFALLKSKVNTNPINYL
ncbi:MAG: Nif3-like dinuclear metal center hexameric protein [Sphingobacteriales bacterium]|nr:MAG: Nif3-like dinuclear metal center hexameric protein [Sphingobacteriales bacterium]